MMNVSFLQQALIGFFSSGLGSTAHVAQTLIERHINKVTVVNTELQKNIRTIIWDFKLDEGLTKENLNARVKQVLCNLLLEHNCTLNPLPRHIRIPRYGNLDDQDLAKVFYLNVENQTNGWTCGYWSVFNAAALESILNEARNANGPVVISAHEIARRARIFYDEYPTIAGAVSLTNPEDHHAHCKCYLCTHHLSQGELTCEEHIAHLATSAIFNLPHETAVHIIGDGGRGEVDSGEKRGFYFHSTSTHPLKNHPLLEDEHLAEKSPEWIQKRLIEKIKESLSDKGIQEPRAHYFLCHIRNESLLHWILIAVVTVPGKPSFLVILDGYNLPILHDSTNSDAGADTAIAFLYSTFLR